MHQKLFMSIFVDNPKVKKTTKTVQIQHFNEALLNMQSENEYELALKL